MNIVKNKWCLSYNIGKSGDEMMGDGRYYTFVQFYNIMGLGLLVIFILVSTVGSYYRNTKNKGSKYITVIFIQIELIVIARFIEEIIVSLNIATALRYSQNSLFIVMCITFAYYLECYVMPIYSPYKNNYIKKKYTAMYRNGMFLIFGMAVFIYEVSTEGNLMIENHTFHSITYTRSYALLLSISILILLIISLKILLLNPKKQIKGFALYKSKILGLLILGMCVLPLCVYLLAITTHILNVDYIEFAFYLMFTVFMNLLVSSFVPYNVTPLMFDSMKDMILDYVFIINESGEILYKNANIDKVYFFEKTNVINSDNMKTLFSGQVKELWDKHGNAYIQLIQNKEKHYFSYKVSILENKNKTIGKIITVTDITELINVLLSLEKKKEEAEEVNLELSEYSEVVYYLEKEKEINELLEEIAAVQENKMLEIVSKIEVVVTKIDEDEFENHIDHIIDLANDNLNQVRKAVTTYKEYYGG